MAYRFRSCRMATQLRRSGPRCRCGIPANAAGMRLHLRRAARSSVSPCFTTVTLRAGVQCDGGASEKQPSVTVSRQLAHCESSAIVCYSLGAGSGTAVVRRSLYKNLKNIIHLLSESLQRQLMMVWRHLSVFVVGHVRRETYRMGT